MNGGTEWIIDASACTPSRLMSLPHVEALLGAVVAELGLHVLQATLHQFPSPYGITAMYLLAESHLTIHTFPESGVATLNLYCCTPKPDYPWATRCTEHLGAAQTRVRVLQRGDADVQATILTSPTTDNRQRPA